MFKVKSPIVHEPGRTNLANGRPSQIRYLLLRSLRGLALTVLPIFLAVPATLSFSAGSSTVTLTTATTQGMASTENTTLPVMESPSIPLSEGVIVSPAAPVTPTPAQQDITVLNIDDSVSSDAACSTPANAIVAENCRTGDTGWDVTGSGDSTIQGFATAISVNRGETIFFKIDTGAIIYHLDIYRLGYYGGAGARRVATLQPSAPLPQRQPACLSDPITGLIDCGNWAVSASWAVPANATSGLYIAKLIRDDTGGASHIVFVVRDDNSRSDLLFQASDTTWQAYNTYGGNSLYTGSPAGRAYKVSYNRPFLTRDWLGGVTWLFNAEYAMVRWLERNGYDVGYFTGVDSDRRGALITNHKVFLSVGHDEYWSGAQRGNVETARNSGTHLGFFSGNEVFW
ncbi:MAG: hypothetical protein MUF20_05655, partial [Methylotetracoccus sp.]|nr:hypothetical protein [Methylotetracoccus sp.]